MPVRNRRLLQALTALCLLLPGRGVAQVSEIRGRVLDRQTGVAVREASVALEGPDTIFVRVTDERGLFTFEGVRGGEYYVTVTHVAYGRHTEPVRVEADAVLALRVLVDAQAIELDPLVVEAISGEELERRARGTMRQEVTRAEIEEAIRTSSHLGDVLRQTVPGLRVYDTTLPGARTCVEFRGRRSIRFANECQSPMVILDGVRMFDPPSLYSTIDPSSIERIEVIPPAEAGLFYGSESAFGVITIETRLWRTRDERQPLPPHLRGGVYDWTLELEGHPTRRAFLSAVVANAVAIGVGFALADRCIEFDQLDKDIFATRCDRLGTAAAWAAAVGIPVGGSALAVRFGGGTPLSRGRLFPALAAGGLAVLPGYAMMSAAQDRRTSATFRAGQVFALLGVPAAVTIADRLFRSLRAP
jgi:hypothetical protein